MKVKLYFKNIVYLFLNKPMGCSAAASSSSCHLLHLLNLTEG